ncbi:hypothetical protein CC79DRAFT_1321878 [Sarocladium strictum]
MRFTSAPVLLGVAFAVSGAHALPKSLLDRQEFTQPAPAPDEGSVPKNTVPEGTTPKEPLAEVEVEEELTGIPAIDGPKDPDMWCGPSLDTPMDWDAAQWVYDMSSPGSLTESYLSSDNPPKRWLENIGRWILHENDGENRGEDVVVRGVSGCGSITQTCEPTLRNLASCLDYFNLDHPNTAWVKQSFWLFRAISGVHAVMKEVETRLVQSTISDALSIQSIVDNFREGIDLDNNNEGAMQAYDMAGTALGIVSAVGGFVPVVGSGIASGAGVLSSMLGLFEPEEPEPVTVNLGQIASSLAGRFDAITAKINRLLETVTGYADGHEDDYAANDRLMASAGDEYSISQILSNPIWFLDVKAPAMKELFDKADHYMHLKLVESVLLGFGFEIVGINGDTDGPRNKDECEGREHGRRWLRVTGQHYQNAEEKISDYWCFGLAYVGTQDEEWNGVADSTQVYAKMGEYGIDRLSQFYLSAIECQRRREQSKSLSPMPGQNEGDYPICMYTMPVKRGWKDPNTDMGVHSTADFFRFLGRTDRLFRYEDQPTY